MHDYAKVNNLDVKDNEQYMMLYRRWNNRDNSAFRYCDGVILDKETQQVVCPGLNKMAEMCGANRQRNIKVLEDHQFFQDVSFDMLKQYSLHDGTLIRLFHHNGQWRKATNRAIDAYQASWGNVSSFGKLFDEVAEETNLDYDKLNKDYCYMIIVQHPNNRIIQPVEKSALIHIGTIDIKTNQEIEHDIGLANNNKFNFQSIQELVQYFDKPECTWTFPGFILVNNRNERIRIENPKYMEVKQLKGILRKETKRWRVREGVDPHMIRMVYLMRDHKDAEYIRYFPENAEFIYKLHDDLNKLRDDIWEVYEQRYILRNFDFPQDQRLSLFIRAVHGIYRNSQEPITIGIVEQNVRAVAPMDTLMHALGYIDYIQTKEEYFRAQQNI